MARHTILAGAHTYNGMINGHFYSISGSGNGIFIDPEHAGLCAVTGVIKHLRFHIMAAAPLVSRLTLYVNQQPTDLSAVIAVGQTSGTDLTNEVAVTAGDQIALCYEGFGVKGYFTVEIDSGLDNFSLIVSGPAVGYANPTVGYFPLTHAHSIASYTTEAWAYCVASVPVTIKKLYLRNSNSSFPAGETVTVTLRVNGVDSVLTATATGPLGTASDLNHEVTIAKGDVVCWSVTASGVGVPYVSLGAIVVPVTAALQQAIWISGLSRTLLSVTAPYYVHPLLHTNKYTPVVTENETMLPGNKVLGNLYVRLNAAPGAAASGKAYTFTVMINGVASTLTCTVLETATAAEDAVHQITVNDGDTISLRATPVNTPDPVTAAWGLAVYGLAPTVTGITPATGMRGSEFSAVITGTNLEDAEEVDLGEDVITEITARSSTSVTVTVSAATGASLAARDVTIETAAGSATLAGGFALIQNPATDGAVSTAAVTNITGSQATLNGRVDENGGQPATCWFEWGSNTAYGMSTPLQVGIYRGASFSAVISPLAAGSSYHVRAAMRTNLGTFYGNDTYFSTQVPAHLPILILGGDTVRLLG